MNFEINITAYKDLGMVNDLVSSLLKTDPNFYIRVWDNSPEPLGVVGVSEVRHNRFNPSLSRVWNWAIAQSRTQWVMLTNDDIRLKKDWLRDLQKDMEESEGALWHGPSRCFLFNKKLLKCVGWFDERFNGLTLEDLDYIRRMNYTNTSHRYGSESSLSRNATCLKDVLRGQRTCQEHNNVGYFKLKYGDANGVIFEGKPRMTTPNFYPDALKEVVT